MKIEDNKITPEEGLYLTQKNIENEYDRFFSDSLFLGVYDSPNNYIEVDEEYKLNWENEYLSEEM